MPNVQLIEMDFADVRERFLRARSERSWPGQPALDRCVRIDWADQSSERWAGGTGSDTERWLRDGFNAEAFALNELHTEPRMRSRASWSEDDGDIDPGRLYGGSDEYMLTQAQRECLPGLTLDIEYDFGRAMGSESIEEYGQWLARLIASIEAAGYDMAVTFTIRASDLFDGQPENERTDLRIIVKRAGEVSNFTSWSAIFAPTGFRHLVFTAYGVAAEAVGKTLARGLGGPVTSGWGCKREDSTITITCSSVGAEYFPAEQLTAEAREARLFQ